MFWPECEGVSCNTKTEGLCKNVNAYICDESVGQGVSIDRDGYSQPVAANHVLILLRVADCFASAHLFLLLPT